MIGLIQGGIKLQKACGEITRGCWQKGSMMRQMRSQTRSCLTLMNGMERVRIISMMFVNCIRLGVGFKQTSYWFYIQQARAQTDDIQQTDDKIMLIAESCAQPSTEKMSIIRELFICSGGGGVGDDVVDNSPPPFLSCECT